MLHIGRAVFLSKAKEHSKPVSLYPLSLDDALRAALQMPPPEKSAPVRLRAASAVPKTEVYKNRAGKEAQPMPKRKKSG